MSSSAVPEVFKLYRELAAVFGYLNGVSTIEEIILREAELVANYLGRQKAQHSVYNILGYTTMVEFLWLLKHW